MLDRIFFGLFLLLIAVWVWSVIGGVHATSARTQCRALGWHEGVTDLRRPWLKACQKYGPDGTETLLLDSVYVLAAKAEG